MTVTVVSTGGTIASTDGTAGGSSPDRTGADLLDAVPGRDALPDVDTIEFGTLPSAHLGLAEMADLLALVRDLDADDEVEGVVVTQGTDVLEEVAFFIDRCYAGTTPVAFTGAMRPADAAGADGPANLRAALVTVVDEDAADRGVLVVFADRVFAAPGVRKVHATAVDAFRDPAYGPLGVVAEDRVAWRRDRADGRPGLDPSPADLDADVPAVTVTAAMSDRLLAACDRAPAACLGTMGAGHVPPSIVPTLESLRASGTALVATTRCTAGSLATDTYDFAGSERTLQELGCYYSPWSLEQTRIQTILGLAAGGLEEVFDRPRNALQ